MAYYDPIKAGHEQDCLENFNKLKEEIQIGEFRLAYKQICNLENKIREQEEKIKEYQEFFGMMQKLMPKPFGVNDVLG